LENINSGYDEIVFGNGLRLPSLVSADNCRRGYVPFADILSKCIFYNPQYFFMGSI
jgi:hypothetical protein